MPGLARPWASRDDALFWLQILAMGCAGALAVVAGAFLVWALLLQPVLAWWHGGGLSIVRQPATWLHWLRIAAVAFAVVGVLFTLFFVWYCDGMLRGSGSASP
jgi:hypothetical protein